MHGTSPDPQSPVAQVNFPYVSVEHWDLAQNLPDHGAVTSIVDEALEVSSKPVEGNCEVPPPVRVAGHIVNAQLFVTVNVAE